MTLIKILSIIEKKTIINYFSNVIKQRVENKRNELKYFIIGRKKKKKNALFLLDTMVYRNSGPERTEINFYLKISVPVSECSSEALGSVPWFRNVQRVSVPEPVVFGTVPSSGLLAFCSITTIISVRPYWPKPYPSLFHRFLSGQKQ